MKTLAFDVYGTLINTQGVVETLQAYIGDQAFEFAQKWRDKQLEYTFRRSLMESYQPFPVCVSQSFDYVCDYYRCDISGSEREQCLKSYRELPAFDDVPESLQQCQADSHRLFAFSNGIQPDVQGLLKTASIIKYFHDVVSVDEIKVFKPSPRVYQHFLQRSESEARDAWLISGNPFDIIGAANTGMNTVWVNRSGRTPFDPWEIPPTVQIHNLSELADALQAF